LDPLGPDDNYWFPDSLSNSRSLDEEFATGCSKLYLRNSCWQPPQPALPWSGVLDATKEAPICVQRGLFPTDTEISGQEDCLYLNVYTPRVKWLLDGQHYYTIFLPWISILIFDFLWMAQYYCAIHFARGSGRENMLSDTDVACVDIYWGCVKTKGKESPVWDEAWH